MNKPSESEDRLRDLIRPFVRYWKAYGGWAALRVSPYLWASILFSVASFGLWTNEGWWATVQSVVPSLMGFTLAGFAIFIGLGNDEFRRFIAARDQDSEEPSPYMCASAAFVHFALVQAFALLFSLILGSAYQVELPTLLVPISDVMVVARYIAWGIGFTIFVYSLMTGVAAAMAIFSVVTWFEDYVSIDKQAGRSKDDVGPSR